MASRTVRNRLIVVGQLDSEDMSGGFSEGRLCGQSDGVEREVTVEL
jgi:hypothetical protein